jgi:hypothetical protein
MRKELDRSVRLCQRVSGTRSRRGGAGGVGSFFRRGAPLREALEPLERVVDEDPVFVVGLITLLHGWCGSCNIHTIYNFCSQLETIILKSK